jgi:hypothetical protein
MSNQKKTLCIIDYQNKITSKYNKKDYKVFSGIRNTVCIYHKTDDGCRGAHDQNEITLSDNIKIFNKLDFSTVDLLKYYKTMKKIILDNKKSLESKHIKLINSVDLSDFIKVLYLWHDLASYYGKYFKNFNDIKDKIRYKTIRSIPNFKFENEDICWVLYRNLKPCHDHWDLVDCINKKKKFPVKKLCNGYINCKFGYHYTNNAICIDNLIKNKCDCKNISIKNDIAKLKKKIKLLKKDLEINNEEKTGQEILEKNEELHRLVEIEYTVKRHLTSEGLKCFNDRLNEENNIKEHTADKKIAPVIVIKR